ncbi:(2Fe-2S)-binding protein [Streptomyces sp. enrichment culture]|uniref:(2Fe-2S)-binding protein n=1 Tax=Streptomyces sp. enrichment culture TaxID=1795815 RepID=UPI003F568E90
MDLDPDLAALRPLGPFFAVRILPGPAGHPAGPPPRPLPTLDRAYAIVTPDDPEDPLGFRVRKVAAALRAPEPRVAASVAHLGLAARLWSIALGCAARCGRLPDLDPRRVHWDPDGGAPDDLWLAGVDSGPADAAALGEAVLGAHLQPLAAALRARYRLAPGLLRGNAASALAGAAREIVRWAGAAGRPETGERARALAADLLGHPSLTGAGTLGGTAFRRRSCCLYYRVPGGGVCGDCCFTSPPRSSPGAAPG